MVQVVLAVVGGFVLAVLSCVALWERPFTFQLSITIYEDHNEVFRFMKEPLNLLEINSLLHAVTVDNHWQDGNRREYITIKMNTTIPHIGTEMINGKFTILPDNKEIILESGWLHGLVHGKILYRILEQTMDGETITEVTGDAEYAAPLAIHSFANKTVVNNHAQILDNLKYEIERLKRTKSDDLIFHSD